MATTWLDLYKQPGPGERKVNLNGEFIGVRFGSYPRNRLDASLFYDGPADSWLGGVDAGLIVHYIGQYSNPAASRKIREWTTLDLVVNYKFRPPQPATTEQVPGYAKDTGNNPGSRKTVTCRSLPSGTIPVGGADGSITPPSLLA